MDARRRRADASCAAEGHGGAADGADESAADAAAGAVNFGRCWHCVFWCGWRLKAADGPGSAAVALGPEDLALIGQEMVPVEKETGKG